MLRPTDRREAWCCCLVARSGVSYQVLIVEDSSPDGTMAVALRLQKVFPGRVRVFKRAGKLGLGSAYMDALKFVKSEFVVLMDADMSHHVSPMPRDWRQSAARHGASVRAHLALRSTRRVPFPPPTLVTGRSPRRSP